MLLISWMFLYISWLFLTNAIFCQSGVCLKRGVVKEVHPEKIILNDGTDVPYGLLVWSTGVGPSQFVKTLNLPKSPGGRYPTHHFFFIFFVCLVEEGEKHSSHLFLSLPLYWLWIALINLIWLFQDWCWWMVEGTFCRRCFCTRRLRRFSWTDREASASCSSTGKELYWEWNWYWWIGKW